MKVWCNKDESRSSKMWKYVDSLDTRFTDILETDRLRIHYSPNRWILVLNRKERKAYSLPKSYIKRTLFSLMCLFITFHTYMKRTKN